MRSWGDRRLLLAVVVFGLIVAACTSSPAAPAGSPVAVGGSPSPVAQPTTAPAVQRPPVGGGAAQPRVQATSQPIGGSAAIIVPTPNFAVNATNVPAAFAPAVSLTTPQPNQPASVSGTLSRIVTPIPAIPGNSSQLGIIGTATAVAGGGGVPANLSVIQNALAAGVGGGGGGQTIPAVQTATPVVRALPPVQPTIAFPTR